MYAHCPARRQRHRRLGGIAPLAAMLSVVILGMVAFAVDISWIVLTKSELKNAADAAALAGAGRLMNGYVLYNLGGQTASQKTAVLSSAMASARAAAKRYAGYNAAGGVNGLVLDDADIQIGFLDQSGKFTASTSTGPYPNTVRVLLRRDSQANGTLPLFFGPVLGMSTVNVTAPAQATCYTASYDSFTSPPAMLPVTYDVNAWNNFLATGLAPDGSSSIAANGSPQLQVYPSLQNVGNFGLISLDDAHVGASTMASWIANGMSANDLQALQNNNLVPLSNHPANTWDWNGENGFKASNVMDMNNLTGKTFLIPLFQPYNASSSNYQAGTGNGSHYFYDIVGFASVTVMPVSDTNRQVVVQPGPTIAASAVFAAGTAVPMGTTSGLQTTFAAPKLTD